MHADVFRHSSLGAHPVILSHGSYGKGRPFQELMPAAWRAMTADYPDILTGSSGKYQAFEVVEPEKWVADVNWARGLISLWRQAPSLAVGSDAVGPSDGRHPPPYPRPAAPGQPPSPASLPERTVATVPACPSTGTVRTIRARPSCAGVPGGLGILRQLRRHLVRAVR